MCLVLERKEQGKRSGRTDVSKLNHFAPVKITDLKKSKTNKEHPIEAFEN